MKGDLGDYAKVEGMVWRLQELVSMIWELGKDHLYIALEEVPSSYPDP
jgi:hypothetical protein